MSDKCNAYGGTLKLSEHKQRFDVHCVLEKGHKGKHTAAVMGRIQRWEGDFVKEPSASIVTCPKGHPVLKGNVCLGCVLDDALKRPRDVTKEFKEKLGTTERVRPGATSNHPGLVKAIEPWRECELRKEHLKSCDSDGYCNACGYQDSSPPVPGTWKRFKNWWHSLFRGGSDW